MSLSRPLPEDVAGFCASLELSPDPVFITDRRNRLVFWNTAIARVLGYSREEMLGTSCAAALRGCDSHGNRYCTESCPVTQIAARGETIRNFDLEIPAKGGRAVRADVTILQITGESAAEFFLVHVLRPRNPDAVARPETPAPPPAPPLTVVRESVDARARRLTNREVEVLGMIAAGLPTPEIAARLHISGLTARNHVQNILDKLEVHSKTEAVAFAFQKGLV